jgi:hypothetical protein
LVAGLRRQQLKLVESRDLKEISKMSTFSDSHVSRLLFVTPALDRVVGLTARRWRRLAAPLFDPYRPELHYMRGPGPKWREKHARDAS